MLWLWVYFGVAVAILGVCLWAARDTSHPTLAENARDTAIGAALASAWPLFLLGALCVFLVLMVNPNALSIFRNQAGGA